MTTQNTNPFVLPGLGQDGEAARNPLMASMEMMRQAWQGLAGSGVAGSSMAPPATLDEMDRRIADLRTVENWLRMNLSMLTGTIQGLEVQRATIGTLKSFVDAAAGVGASAHGPSPLDVVLGIHRQAQPADASTTRPDHAAKKGKAAGPAGQSAGAATEAAESPAAGTADVPAAAQAWWNMLQKQFDTLAAATTATMQGAEAMKSAAIKPRGRATQDPSTRSAPSTEESSTAKKTAARGAPRKRAGAASIGKSRS